MRKLSKAIGVNLGMALMSMSAIAYAQAPQQQTGITMQNILNILKQFLQYFAIFVFLMAVASILYAAFLFFTSGGNEEKVSTAKKVLIWAIVGIAVAIFAYYAIPFVCNLLGLGANCQSTTF